MIEVKRMQHLYFHDVLGRYFQLSTLIFLTMLADNLMTSLAQSPSCSFRPISHENGSAVCLSSKPSLGLSIYDPCLAAMCPAFESIPRVVCCAYFCASSTSLIGSCVGFNFRLDVGQCDFHTSVITSSFSTQSGCLYYSVIATGSDTINTPYPDASFSNATTAVNDQLSTAMTSTLTTLSAARTTAINQTAMSNTDNTTPAIALSASSATSVHQAVTKKTPAATTTQSATGSVTQAGMSNTASAGVPGTPGTPILVTVISDPNNNQQIAAMAVLNGQLFVTRNSQSGVYVYNTTSFQLTRKMTSSTLGNSLTGLATSAGNNYLYIADNQNKCVQRVDLPVTTSTVSVTSWLPSGTPQALSVTSSGNVLVVTSDHVIAEYTPSGSFVRRYGDGSAVNYAMEVSNGAWAYSLSNPAHGIRVVLNGVIVQRLESTSGSAITQMNCPYGLANDTHGYILVADSANNRILAVSPSLTDARLLPLPAGINLNSPGALVLDQSSGRLYIGEFGGNSRVLVFGNVTNVYALFNN